MPFPYQSTVCRGSVYLGNGCGHCERCQDERAEMLRNQQRAAEKSDVHVASELDSWKATEGSPEIVVASVYAETIAATSIQAAPSPIAGHVQGLPVAGYAPNVEQWKVDMVNENKILEEKVLRRVDEHVRERGDTSIDGASVQIARRHVEDAFYRLNRAIMQPKRIQGDLE